MLPLEGSDFNLLTLPDVVITQSGSEILSESQLVKLVDDTNEDYETIWGYAVQPSGLLLSAVSVFPSNTSFNASLPANTVIEAYNAYVNGLSDRYGNIVIGADLGSAKYTDYMYIGHTDKFMAMGRGPVGDSNGFGIFKSTNNSAWNRIDTAYPVNYYWHQFTSSRSVPYTRTSSRYVSYMGNIKTQLSGTTHVNDRRTTWPVVLFSYDTQASGIQDYEMKIDLGDVYDIFSVMIEDNSDMHKYSYPYKVTYALEDVEYGYKDKKSILDHAFMLKAGDISERSPVPTIYDNPSNVYQSIVMNCMIYNPNDNCLYLYYTGTMYKFDLKMRVWNTLATNSYQIYNSEITLDTVSNEIYGVGNNFWKYSIYKNTYEILAPPPRSLTSGTISNICYSSTTNSLYCGVSTTSTFFRYDIETDTWSQKANATTGFYFFRGCRTIYCDYNNSIYAILSNRSSSCSPYGLIKYSVLENTWTNVSTDFTGHISYGGYNTFVEWILDSKRQQIHMLYNHNENSHIVYHIKSNSWVGYPCSYYYDYAGMICINETIDHVSLDFRVPLSGYTSICYVPSEDRVYSHGESSNRDVGSYPQYNDNYWNKVLRYSVPLERIYSAEHLILDRARYIKIKGNDSKIGYPLMMKKLKVSPPKAFYNSPIGYNILETNVSEIEEPLTINLANNATDIVYSGMAYLEDNSSNYFEICDTISGIYTTSILDLTFPDGLLPASGYNIYARHKKIEGEQIPISTINLNILLEGLKDG